MAACEVTDIIFDTCETCGIEEEKMKRCGKCRAVHYCSAECQKLDWPRHKASCKKSVTQSTNYKACVVCKRRDASVKPCDDCNCQIVTYCSETCKKQDATNHRWQCLIVKWLVQGEQFAERIKLLIGGHDVCTIDEIVLHHMMSDKPFVVIGKITRHLIIREMLPPPLGFIIPPRIIHGVTIQDGEGNERDVHFEFTNPFPHFQFEDAEKGSYVLLFNPPVKMPPFHQLMMGEEPIIAMERAQDVKIMKV
ncbi:uncharacterized protein LOC135502734 isoform X1 [Lineus longissimus]|uniref:uncharacterized protein LOC135502734 isoform X1 n=1 Tax=Lineus longissimus TaxID=88925 RepID=UPI00315D8651